MKSKEEILKKLGARIQKIRESKNISQSDLARLSDKDRQNIYRLEKGKINPSVYFICEIANALEINVSELMNID